MNYQHSITILSDGKTVTAKNDKTGTEAIARCSPEDEFNLAIGASLAIERLIEKEREIKAGDIVRFAENFDYLCVYPYAAEFVENLKIPTSLKVRYCYSITHPPLTSEYIVQAISNTLTNKVAYIQSASGWGRCFVVNAKILKKV